MEHMDSKLQIDLRDRLRVADSGWTHLIEGRFHPRVKEAEDLAKVVTDQFVKVEGITRTMTLIAFRCYSNYDLEHMFSIGN
jgi:hypothetical protein